MLADNRLSDLGGHDERKLLALLADLEQSSQQLAGTGYAQEDVDALISRLDEQADAFFAQLDQESPAVGKAEPDSHSATLPRPSAGQGSHDLGRLPPNIGSLHEKNRWASGMTRVRLSTSCVRRAISRQNLCRGFRSWSPAGTNANNSSCSIS